MSIRVESDSVGTREVPSEAYYGVQSMRAGENFTITGIGMNPVFLKKSRSDQKGCSNYERSWW